MNNLRRILISLLVLMSLLNASCSERNHPIQFEGFWVVQPPSVARSTAAYGTIRNRGNEADTLIKVSSDIGFVMLHKTEVVNGMGKMMHLGKHVLEAGDSLVLEPMSYHLMFSKMPDKIYNEGETATLIFEFEKAGLIEIEAPIRPSWE